MKLLPKLLYYLDVKWRIVIKQWRHANGEASYPSFLKFAEFVREAAERANIPELEGMITPTTPKPVRNQKPKYEKNIASSLITSVMNDPNPKEPNKQKRSGPTDSSKCLFCGQRHKLDDCQDFCKTFSFVNVCVWAVRSVRVIKSKIAKKGLSVKRAQGCTPPAFIRNNHKSMSSFLIV